MGTWKQLYAQATTRQGAIQDVGRRCVAAANDSGVLELAIGGEARRMLPLCLLCASLDAYGIKVPDEPSALIMASDLALQQ
jgi:hypothetical protein